MSGGTDIIACFVGGNPMGPVWRGEIQARALGMAVDVFDDTGRPVRGGKGELVCTGSFPSMPVEFWNDPNGETYRDAYFAKFPNTWCHGDYVALTEHQWHRHLRPLGRGVESRRRAHRHRRDLPPGRAPGRGGGGVGDRPGLGGRRRGWSCSCGCATAPPSTRRLLDKIKTQIRRNASPRHVPARILQVADIPRTKSGKIVELAVRDVVHGRPVKNLEALANPEALELFRDRPELAT